MNVCDNTIATYFGLAMLALGLAGLVLAVAFSIMILRDK